MLTFNFYCSIYQEVLKWFSPKYEKQIRANFPKKFVDTSGGISKEQKLVNAIQVVKVFNQLFNKRETDEDRKQKKEKATESDKQFIEHSGETPVQKKKSKKRNA